MSAFELHLPVEQVINAIELLFDACERDERQLSKQALKQVMQKGAVWLTDNGKTRRVRRAKTKLKIGQELHLYYNSDALTDDFEHPALVEDCGVYSVWYKPSGMMSQGSKWGDHSTIARFAELNLEPQRTAFLVHRLDRATQGVILVAHTKQAVKVLTGLFEQRNITKKYQAIVDGRFIEPKVYKKNIDGRSAHTKVSPLSYCNKNNYTLVDVEIGTGRKHQIRRHLSEDGFAIIGDRLYGAADSSTECDLQLCAYSLVFECPLLNKKQQFLVTPKLLLSI